MKSCPPLLLVNDLNLLQQLEKEGMFALELLY